MSMIMSPVDAIAELFGSEGAADYLGEPVTVAAHLLQAGARPTPPARRLRWSRRRCCTTSATCAAPTPRRTRWS